MWGFLRSNKASTLITCPTTVKTEIERSNCSITLLLITVAALIAGLEDPGQVTQPARASSSPMSAPGRWHKPSAAPLRAKRLEMDSSTENLKFAISPSRLRYNEDKKKKTFPEQPSHVFLETTGIREMHPFCQSDKRAHHREEQGDVHGKKELWV